MEEKNNNSFFTSWLALIVIVIGTFMAVLDGSIVNVALPKIMNVFGASTDDAKWIITAYTLAEGAIIPLTGYLEEVVGSKKVYIFALTTFTIGSLLCGLSWNINSMIAFRTFQAIGGGMIIPVGMTIVYSIFPKNKIGLAIGIWGIASMAAPAVGPTVGGYIVETLDWRIIFYLNIPIGIIGVFMSTFLLKDSGDRKFKSFDIIGFLSSTIGIVSLLYVLGEWTSIDWSKMEYPLLLVLGLLSMVLFVVNELTHPNPLIDLRILKLRDFSISLIAVSVLCIALMGGTYILPLFLENVRGYTAMETGLIMLPPALVVGILMPISGTLFDKVGVKPLAIPGILILGISSYQLAAAINMNSSKDYIILISCLRSVGLGLAMMPINTIGMNALPQKFVGKGSALSSTIRQIASSIAVTIVSTIMTSKTNYNYLKLSEQISVYNHTAQNTISTLTNAYIYSGQSKGTASASALSTISQMLEGQASIDAMGYAMAVTAAMAFAAAVLILFFSGKKSTSKQHKKGDKNVTKKELAN